MDVKLEPVITSPATFGISAEPNVVFILGHRDPGEAGKVCYLCKPDWRGQLSQLALKLTSDPAKAMRWTEKSGAYKYLKRHKEKLYDFHVRWYRLTPMVKARKP